MVTTCYQTPWTIQVLSDTHDVFLLIPRTRLTRLTYNVVRTWDIKPFAIESSRQLKRFEGAPHGFEKNLLKPCWSPDGDFIAAGGGDRTVTVWETNSRKVVYKLPGKSWIARATDAAPSNDTAVIVCITHRS